MGRLIWNESGGLTGKIGSPVSIITGANLKKKPVTNEPNNEPSAARQHLMMCFPDATEEELDYLESIT